MSRLLAARNSNHLFIIVAIYICFYKTASHVQRNKKVRTKKGGIESRFPSLSPSFSLHLFSLSFPVSPLLLFPLYRLLSRSPPPRSLLCLTFYLSPFPLPSASLSFYLFLSLPYFRSSRLAPSLLSRLYLSLPTPSPLSLFSLIDTSLSPPFSRDPAGTCLFGALPRVGSGQVKTESDAGVTVGECTYISLLLTFVIG